ncbi:MAG: pilus assembly protein PilM [Pirellulaceae bacterium]|nr:MAG: pilus assembly protein PilM [Pirellulaceae bacterium]
MAKVNGVWGIDIGQCALKAMRCRKDGDRVVADAFDYIEYPKILSQPDEDDPKQLVQDALEQFLSRNEVKGYRIAIAVPGQAGLSRFFKPPPVDAKKIPDIVKYEARQVIPFPLDEVIWDYQLLGGQEVEGFTIDAEVGLFAMKRDQVERAIEPFQRVGVELDIVQLAPLSLFNFVTFELLADRATVYDPDNPPPSIIVLSLGTDTTDLVVTNGFRVWQRSIAIGGNHFTKQLTKELKLTFAQAEHLKRNARQADDPKRVFQAMRPVFNDLVREVQRSINYFQNIDRKARLEGVVLLGNTVKLPGLQPFLAKNLGYDVIHFDQFRKLDESAIINAPAFKENLLAFAVSYGLCLQGLDVAKLRTNLIPRELLVERMVRAKKPWALATVASVLLACTVNFLFNYSVWYRAHPTYRANNVSWRDVEQLADNVKRVSSTYLSTDRELLSRKTLLEKLGDEVVGNADRRILWLELITAFNQGLPRTEGVEPGTVPDPKQIPFSQRKELHIEGLESLYVSDLSQWFNEGIRKRYEETLRVIRSSGNQAAGSNTPAPTDQLNAATPVTGPTGEGWVLRFSGYHFYNEDAEKGGSAHLYNTIIKFLEQGTVVLPNPKAGGQLVQFSVKELGIGYPVLVQESPIQKDFRIPNPNYTGPGAASGNTLAGGGFEPGSVGPGGFPMPPGFEDAGGVEPAGVGGPGFATPPGFPASGFPASGGPASGFPGGSGGIAGQGATAAGEIPKDANGEPAYFTAPRYQFRIEFCWQPVPLTKRLQMREEAVRQQAAEAAAQQANNVSGPEQVAGVMPDGGNR